MVQSHLKGVLPVVLLSVAVYNLLFHQNIEDDDLLHLRPFQISANIKRDMSVTDGPVPIYGNVLKEAAVKKVMSGDQR